MMANADVHFEFGGFVPQEFPCRQDVMKVAKTCVVQYYAPPFMFGVDE